MATAYWVPNFDFAGSTSVHTTAADLVRWAENIIRPRAGWAEAVERLTTPGQARHHSVRYGAGVEIGTSRPINGA